MEAPLLLMGFLWGWCIGSAAWTSVLVRLRSVQEQTARTVDAGHADEAATPISRMR